MPLDPEVTGYGVSPIPSRMSLAIRATCAVVGRSTPGPGSKSSTIRSGFRSLPSRANCHCGTCSSSAAAWASQASVARSSTSGYTFVPDECCTGRRCTQSGTPAPRSFSKNAFSGSRSVPTPFGQRFLVSGRFAAYGISAGAIAV